MPRKNHEIAKVFFDIAKYAFTIGVLGAGLKDPFNPWFAIMSLIAGTAALLIGMRIFDLEDKDND